MLLNHEGDMAPLPACQMWYKAGSDFSQILPNFKAHHTNEAVVLQFHHPELRLARRDSSFITAPVSFLNQSSHSSMAARHPPYDEHTLGATQQRADSSVLQ